MTTIFEEFPFAYVLGEDEAEYLCHFCLAGLDPDSFVQCSECKFARYCDQNCKESATKDHAEECKCLKKVAPTVPKMLTRMVARIMFKLKEDPAQMESDSKDGVRTFKALCSHLDEIVKDEERMKDIRFVHEELVRIMPDDFDCSFQRVLEMLAKVLINSFKLVNNFGCGLYLDLSILDHSCDPDAIIICAGLKAKLNVIKNVENVESMNWKDLRFTYVDSKKRTQERQEFLKKHYYFDCKCSLCLDVERDAMKCSFECDSTKNCEGPVVKSCEQVPTTTDGRVMVLKKCQMCGAISTLTPIFEKRSAQLIDNFLKEFSSSDEDTDSEGTMEDAKDEKEGGNLTISQQFDKVAQAVEQCSFFHPIYNLKLNELIFIGINMLTKFPPAISMTPSQKSWFLKWQQPYMRGLKWLYQRPAPVIARALLLIASVLRKMGEFDLADIRFKEAMEEASITYGTRHEICEAIQDAWAKNTTEKQIAEKFGKMAWPVTMAKKPAQS